ncbi:DUF4123 domain-containing protein [Achromobacter sp. NFACC18-2]|uniref:DUF4123 domain-containing protein n=1 Tax=Achromobacter sp. NFACC18-2 TaxID=1564112 RepID=UPI0008CC36E7|nr:DUF4123 domain-containing protein [Achromobacter sp. NFACC18-2]SEK09759.1 protein of unknown function [Achromobacter sp. NFACC18-2]
MITAFAQELIDALRKSSSHRLTAIVEMARMPAPARQPFLDRHAPNAWPLLNQQRFSNLRDVGPWLVAAAPGSDLQGQYDFHRALTDATSDALCGWLISALPPSALAGHLAQATTAQAPDGHSYMLRFHTELAFPILHARRDLPGIGQLLAPIQSWWVIEPHPERKAWRHYAGYDQPQLAGVPLIQLDQACWDALAGDPLSYSLAEQLREPLAASGFAENCHGTRLGLVGKLLREARAEGLRRPGDLADYVTLLALHGPTLRGMDAWQAALTEACNDGLPLAQALKSRAFPNL